ncbi:CRISPR-associated endonuclease Cas1 [Sodaliphilus sp.]|uniref:CRISPR-associated endonuclease Cas1 n=1 Tax=Sodaliphilus sp. TaxID=2815818 RepID=UPI00388F8FD8
MELVINTFGASIKRDKEAFVIANKDGQQRIPVDGVTSIVMGRGVLVTSDAVMLAVEHEIDMIFSDKAGSMVGRVWSPRYGSVSSIRKGQINFTFSHDALTWIKKVIARKIENQQALLLMFNSDDGSATQLTRKSIARMEDYRTKVLAVEGDVVADVAPSLRGWEGLASRIYFETLNTFLPRNLQFGKRSQRPAIDPFNAFLNYGYGMLYGKVEGALIKAGVDPYVGVMHRDDYNRPVLAYDIIERYRVWVDYVVTNLACQSVINEDYYSVHDDGSCWLEGLGRRVLIQSVNDYLDEVVEVSDDMQRSRATIIQMDAHKLANMFKQYV